MNISIETITKKTNIVFISNIFGKFIAFFSVILITRLIGAVAYGEFIYSISIISIFGILPSLGLSNGIISFLSRDNITKNQKKSLLSYSILISSSINLIVIFFTYIIYENILSNIFIKSNSEEFFLYLLPTILVNNINNIFMSALVGIGKNNEIINYKNILFPALKVFFIFLFFTFNMNSYFILVISYYIIILIETLYYFRVLKKHEYIGAIDFTFDNRSIVIFSIPLIFSGIVAVLMQNIDKFYIGYLLGAESVAIYNIALLFGTFSSLILISFNSIFGPIISNLYHSQKWNELYKIYKFCTKLITLVNVIIIGFIFVFSSSLMNFAGDSFVNGNTALIIISAGQLINSIVGSVGYINIMSGNSKYYLISSVLSLIINLSLNSLLIPILGINGAAVATMISIMINNILNFIFMYRKFKFNPYDISYLKIFFVIFISSIVVKYISNLIEIIYYYEVFIFGIIYLIITFIMINSFVFDKNEMSILKDSIVKSKN